jgi:hypothetical protein
MRRNNCLFRVALAGLSISMSLSAFAQGRGRGAAPLPPITHPELNGPDLTGVYQLVPNGVTLPGGLKNEGGPDEVPLQAAAVAKQKATNLKDDVKNLCLPVGPFRMMAWPGNKLDVYRSPGRINVHFENYFLGHIRFLYLDRAQHKPGPYWVGDSVARWDGETLVVDTTGFNEYTWLNGNGAPHSDALHLTERYRLIENGKYLELKVTADDPKVLTAPYTYTRYYERTTNEIQEYVCWDDVLTVGK